MCRYFIIEYNTAWVELSWVLCPPLYSTQLITRNRCTQLKYLSTHSNQVGSCNDHDYLLTLKILVWSNHDLLLDWTTMISTVSGNENNQIKSCFRLISLLLYKHNLMLERNGDFSGHKPPTSGTFLCVFEYVDENFLYYGRHDVFLYHKI